MIRTERQEPCIIAAAFICSAASLQAQGKNLDEVWRLDLERNVWETVTAMPIARKFARAVVFMNSVYIVGGSVVPANSHSPAGSTSVLQFTQPGCP